MLGPALSPSIHLRPAEHPGVWPHPHPVSFSPAEAWGAGGAGGGGEAGEHGGGRGQPGPWAQSPCPRRLEARRDQLGLSTKGPSQGCTGHGRLGCAQLCGPDSPVKP